MPHALINRCFRIWREARWVILGQFAIFVGGIATVKVLTTELGPAMYGQLTLGVSIAGALQLFVYGPLNQIVIRYFSIYYERGKLPVYFHVLGKVYLYAVSLVTLITTLVFTVFLVWGSSEWAMFVLLAVVYGCMNGMLAGGCAFYDATRNRKKSAAFHSFAVWARLLFALLLFYLLDASAHTALLGFCLGVLVVSVMQTSGLREVIAKHKGMQHEPFSEYKYVAECFGEFKKYAFPFLLFALVGIFGAYADRWIIFERLGEEEVGTYVALYQIANAPVALVMAFAQQYSAPIIFQRAGATEYCNQSSGAERLLLYTVFAFVAALLPLIILFWFYSEEIVRLFTSESFIGHHELLWFLPFGIMGFSAGQLFVLKGQFLNKPMVYLWPKILHALSLVVLTYYLVTELGIIGAAYAFCVASMVYLSSVVLVNRKLS